MLTKKQIADAIEELKQEGERLTDNRIKEIMEIKEFLKFFSWFDAKTEEGIWLGKLTSSIEEKSFKESLIIVNLHYKDYMSSINANAEKENFSYIISNLQSKLQEHCDREEARELLQEIIKNTKLTKTLELKFKTLATLTGKGYTKALTATTDNELIETDEKAFLKILDKDFFELLVFENGEVEFKDEPMINVKLQDMKTYENVKNIDWVLLRGIYSFVFQNAELCTIKDNIAHMHVNVLANYLGVRIYTDTNKQNCLNILKKIQQFNNVIGIIKRNGIYPVLGFIAYNDTTGIFKLNVHFMMNLIEVMKKDFATTKKLKNGKKQPYIDLHHSYLIHSDICNERNKNAVLVVERLIQFIQMAGNAEKKEIMYQTIIDDIPLLKQTLDESKIRQEKNTILKRVFEKAFELMVTKTDVYKYYLDLVITNIIPTSSTLDLKVKITHNGRIKS